MNLKAKVVYRNRNLEPVYECEYMLKDYADVLSMDMKKIVSDVEDLVYLANGNKPKEEWTEAELVAFNKIRCKLLDKAGEMSRLPESLYDADADKSGSPGTFWERMFDEKRR